MNNHVTIVRYILIAMLFSSCQHKTISWEASLKTTKDGTLELVNRFKSSKEFDIIFDIKAFSYDCYYGEEIKLEDSIPKIDFRYNQIIIENENSMRRLYSNINFEEGEVKDISEVNCMFDWYEYLRLGKDTKFITIEIPYLSDLKVTDNDRKVRLIYVFKPTLEQRSKGYSNLVLESNWINLHRRIWWRF